MLGPLRRPGDGDLWWQRWLGDLILSRHAIPQTLGPETFTSQGVPWVPQEWMFSVWVAWTSAHHLFVVLALLVSLIPAGILVSVYVRSRERAGPVAIAVAMIFCAIALAASFGVRAQVLGWGCFALFLLCLERRDAWFYLAVPVVALWANLHASAMLAPAFLAARLVGGTLDGGITWLRGSRELRILPLVAAALFCTPLGWHLPAYAVALSASPIRHYIQEWQPVSLGDIDFYLGAFPLALAIAIGGVRAAWRDKAESLPVALLLLAALFAKRDVPLFAIAAAPLAARSFDLRFARLKRIEARIPELEAFAMVAIVVALAINAAALVLVQRVEAPALPVAAIAQLAAGGHDRRLLCEDFTDCSLALQYPNLRVFMDGRCDPYPLTIWQQYLSTIGVRPSWKSTLARYNVDAVVASASGRFAKTLSRDAGWRRVYRDESFVLYERT